MGNASEQLRYTCSRCGNCCRWAGYVRLTADEVAAIAAHLGLSVELFVERYTRLPDDRQNLSLIENAAGHCIFLTDEGACLVQAVKPRQCRLFPNFWSFPGFRDQCQAVDNWQEE